MAHRVGHAGHSLLLLRQSVVETDANSVVEIAIVEEAMCDEEMQEDEGDVEKLTKDKTKEICVVVVVNILPEEVDQLVPLLLVVLDDPRGGSLGEELHEPALHAEPDEAWHVEQDGPEYEVERDPLVVGVVDDGAGEAVLVPATAGTLVLGRDVECGVHQTVGVQHLLMYSTGDSTSIASVDTNILFSFVDVLDQFLKYYFKQK